MRTAEESDAFPLIDRAGDRLARGMRELFASLGIVGLTAMREPTTLLAFDSWCDTAPATLFIRYRAAPLKRPLLLAMPTSFFTALVDLYFGGAGLPHKVGEELTAAEARFANRFAGQFSAHLGSALSELGAGRPIVETLALKPADASSLAGHEPIAVQEFQLAGATMGDQMLAILYPVSALRGLQAEVEGELEELVSGTDPHWTAQMQHAMRDVRLPVRSVLARPELGLSQLLTLKPGDVIPLLMPQHVPLTVSGRPFAVGSMGEANGRAAIRIDKIMKGCSQ